ncbi:MAG: hypothetical protein WCL49_02575 [bacterium]
MTLLTNTSIRRRLALFSIQTALTGLLFGLSGCTLPPQDTQGTREITRHNWWNYYEHAMERMHAGDFTTAQSDLKRCLGITPGAVYGQEKDAWRVRTYGLHFAEDCFPRRELGICLLYAGQPQEAILFLEQSLQQTPSGRAKQYLNRARRTLLARNSPPPLPQIDLAPECLSVWTKERKRTLTGKAQATGWINRLAINGKPEFLELAQQSQPFRNNIALRSGTNVIAVEARDLLGQRTAQNVVWMADWIPPELHVRESHREGNDWVVEGLCADNESLVSISTSGLDLFRGTPEQRRKNVPFTLRLRSGTPTILMAEDAAGNRLQTVLSAEAFEKDYSAGLPGPATAFLCTQAVVSDAPPGQYQALASAEASTDKLPPTLRLTADRPLAHSFDEEYFIDGNVTDGGGLAALTINGEDLLEGKGQGIKRSYFARRLPLQLGTNTFEIIARDLSGNRTSKSLTVVRTVPEYLDEEYRLRIGIPPIVTPPPITTGILVKQAIEHELTRSPLRFRLLEREEGWDYILREQGLSVSDLADPAAALKIGKMLPAEILLMARLLPQAGGTTIYLRGVETRNGDVMFSDDVYSEALDKDLDDLIGGLTMKIKQRFPLVMANIVRVAGSEVTLGAGTDQGIEPGARFIVVQTPGSLSNPGSGEVCKKDGKWVELAVRRVKRDSGIAGIVPASAAESIRNGDTAYAR